MRYIKQLVVFVILPMWINGNVFSEFFDGCNIFWEKR